MVISSETKFIGISSDISVEQKRSATINDQSEGFTAQDILGAALTQITFSELPSSPTTGLIVSISDSNTETWGATVSDGGSYSILAWYNGTNWTVLGK